MAVLMPSYAAVWPRFIKAVTRAKRAGWLGAPQPFHRKVEWERDLPHGSYLLKLPPDAWR